MKAEITAGDIIGAWQLRSWLIHYEDGRDPGTPYGNKPCGLLLYGPDFWMSATVSRPDRPPFPAGRSPRSLGNDLIADAYWSYFHYAGPYRIDGDRVIHSVHHSLNPGLAGTDQVRQMKLNPPLLTLTGVEEIPGGMRRHELVWRRATV